MTVQSAPDQEGCDMSNQYRSQRYLQANQPRKKVERPHKGESILGHFNDYVVIDIETTGLSPKTHEIIEIGAVKVVDGDVADTFQQLIKPYGGVPTFIEGLTGISNAMVKDAPDIDEVLPLFVDFIGDAVLVAHNAHFDINFLYDACMVHTTQPLRNNFVDTLRLSRKVFKQLRSHKLEIISAHCNVHNDQAHRALSDCYCTQGIYEYMKRYAVE